jgi:hypothetical protein
MLTTLLGIHAYVVNYGHVPCLLPDTAVPQQVIYKNKLMTVKFYNFFYPTFAAYNLFFFRLKFCDSKETTQLERTKYYNTNKKLFVEMTME